VIFPQKDSLNAKTSTNVYIDFSNGMPPIISSGKIFFDKVLNMTDKNSATYYKVGQGLTPIKGSLFDTQHPENNPHNPANCTQKISDLDFAVADIIKNNNSESVFITDFELYKDALPDSTPWAIRPFSNWLSKGNAINVFAKPVVNAGIKQHLYVLVFTPISLLRNESPQLVLNQLKKEGYTEVNAPDGVVWIPFGIGLHTVNKDSYGKEGGLNKDISAESKELNKFYDYYCLSFDNVNSFLKLPKDESPDKTLLSYLKYSDFASNFQKPQFEINVKNITKCFTQGTKVSEAADASNVFILNNSENVLGISMNSDFIKNRNGNLAQPCELYRVEIWLKKTELRLDEATIQRTLTWTNARNVKMRSLGESLVSAMKQIDFKEQLLFTYYIELQN
jgi:hypothetical protein